MGEKIDLEIKPSVVLVGPQLAENVGTVARAMLNFGLNDLRLVEPREHWLGENAIAAASGAGIVLEEAKIFKTTELAVADLHTVYAMTGRQRDMTKMIMSPNSAVRKMHGDVVQGKRPGVLFGPEASGLNNDNIALADAIVEIPTNSTFKSLNLAMAVLVLGYEWFLQTTEGTPDTSLDVGRGRAATKRELQGLFGHLEGALDDCGFLRVQEKRPHMVRSIRNIFQRARLTEQEVRTFRGVVSGLVTHASERRKIVEDG